MTLLALASLKASPGVTTAAVALGGVWPRDGALLVEADPDGGVLTTRFDLPAEGRSMTSLAAAGRHRVTEALVRQHAQTLPGGLPAVPASPVPSQASSAVRQLARPMAVVLSGSDGLDAIVDCGRLNAASPAWPLAQVADLLLVVCRPRLEELRLVLAGLTDAPTAGVGLLLIGDQPFGLSQIREVFAERVGVDEVYTLADDPRSAQTLIDQGGNGTRGLRRSPLLRSARSIAERIEERLHGPDLARRAS